MKGLIIDTRCVRNDKCVCYDDSWKRILLLYFRGRSFEKNSLNDKSTNRFLFLSQISGMLFWFFQYFKIVGIIYLSRFYFYYFLAGEAVFAKKKNIFFYINSNIDKYFLAFAWMHSCCVHLCACVSAKLLQFETPKQLLLSFRSRYATQAE